MSVSSKSETKKSGGLGETISVIVQALLLALVIRTILFQPFSMPMAIRAFRCPSVSTCFRAVSGARNRSAAMWWFSSCRATLPLITLSV
jgi:hypothetical protein